MRAQTAVERILSRHSQGPVFAGDFIFPRVDLVMAQDGNAPLAIQLLHDELGAFAPIDGSRIVLVIDHCGPSPNERASNLQQIMRRFKDEVGATLYDVGEGISHVLLPERGHARPGGLVVGSDSHSVTYGAVNCLGTGMGSTDIAVAMATGKVWLRVPEAMRVELVGSLRAPASAKDLALHLVRTIGVDGATYRCLEIDGEGLASLDMESRFSICNMAVEMGAKCALMPCDDRCAAYLAERVPAPLDPVWSEPGCAYAATVTVDLAEVEPLTALPHDLTRIVPVRSVRGQRVDLAFIGTCTNSRFADLDAASAVLAGRHVADGVRLVVVPGSRETYRQALRAGTIETLLAAGAVIAPPGCGPCVGTHMGVPGDGEVVISTANRNSRGRMGNRQASVFLGSPQTVAASAVLGRVGSAEEL